MRKELGLLVLLVLVGGITGAINPDFLSGVNLLNLANLIGLFGVFSIGEGLVIITGGIDLSVGSMFALLGVVFIDLLTLYGWPWPLALAAVIAGGVVLGGLQGFLVTRLKMQPFVVTLCGLLIYRGAARYYTTDSTRGFGYGDEADVISQLASGHFYGVPAPFLYLLGIAVVVGVVLHKSVYGRYLYAVGKNEEAARFSGIRTGWVIAGAYLMAGGLAGVSTVLLVFYTNSVSPSSFGSFYELYAIAAAVLGGCSLRGGEGSILGIVLGTALLQVLQNLVNILGIPSSLNYAVMGTVILLGVLTDQRLQQRRRERLARAVATSARAPVAATAAISGRRRAVTGASVPSAAGLRQAVGRTLHDKIANTLGAAIVAGQHAPGAALPTEVDLCARLSVSRSALREAFKLLAAKRLIRSRQKVGTVVRERSEWNMLDPEVLGWHLAGTPTDAFISGLFEVRRIVEPEAAALAAQRRSPDQARTLEQAFSDMVAFQDGSGDLADADLRFHQAILDATGNFFLASLGAVIESALISSFRMSWDGAAHTPEHSLRLHGLVVEAVRAGQPEPARAVMTELLGAAIQDVRQSLARRRSGAAGRAA